MCDVTVEFYLRLASLTIHFLPSKFLTLTAFFSVFLRPSKYQIHTRLQHSIVVEQVRKLRRAKKAEEEGRRKKMPLCSVL